MASFAAEHQATYSSIILENTVRSKVLAAAALFDLKKYSARPLYVALEKGSNVYHHS